MCGVTGDASLVFPGKALFVTGQWKINFQKSKNLKLIYLLASVALELGLDIYGNHQKINV